MKKILLILLIISSFSLNAQESFTADRPGQTVSAYLLPKGAFQIEAGFNYSGSILFDDDDLDRSYSLPHIMLRYGLLDFLELRIENQYQIWDSHFGPTQKGLNDFKFSTKLDLLSKQDVFNLALVSYVTFPQDDSPLSEGKYTFGSAVAANLQVSDGFFAAANLGFYKDGNQIYHAIYSVSATLALSEKWSMFGEFYADTFEPEYANSRTETGINIGVSKMFGDSLQLDTFLGKTPLVDGPSFNLGISWRL
ncbi:MAG: hypothetical protein CL663_01505 [Bacteroidetes bacterium]|nr:hypothetical protein [Bacteroidota bacterium]